MHQLFITNVFIEKATGAFCLMLMHSLWQGLLFTFITGLVMMFTKKSSAALRYNIMAVLFFSFIILCAFTFVRELNSTTKHTIEQQNAFTGILPGGSIQLFLKNIGIYCSANASIIMMIWFLVFFAKSVKMMASLVYCQRIKHHNTQQPPACWKNKIAGLCEQLHLKKSVLLLESKIIKIPVVLGHLKPIIFIPVGLLTSLPPGEVEAVLLHELAHIRRNDYFVNIIQVIAENIFFFNPALLWMSSLLRQERENCCDDVAVAQTKSKAQFIQALISFKEHALFANNYTTAFPARKNQLLQRVTRLIHNKNKPLNSVERAFFFISFLLLVILSVAATNFKAGLTTKEIIQKEAVIIKQTPVVEVPVAGDVTVIAENIKHSSIIKKATPGHDNAKANYNPEVKIAASHKPLVFEEYKKVITDSYSDAVEMDGKGEEKSVLQGLTNAQLAEFDRQQAVKDQEVAEEDLKLAELDRIQAEKDHEQALKNRKQSELDFMQAKKDQQMHEKEK